MVKTDLYWGGRLEYKKQSKNNSTTTLNFFYAKKNAKKRYFKIDAIWRSGKMAILQGLH